MHMQLLPCMSGKVHGRFRCVRERKKPSRKGRPAGPTTKRSGHACSGSGALCLAAVTLWRSVRSEQLYLLDAACTHLPTLWILYLHRGPRSPSGRYNAMAAPPARIRSSHARTGALKKL